MKSFWEFILKNGVLLLKKYVCSFLFSELSNENIKQM